MRAEAAASAAEPLVPSVFFCGKGFVQCSVADEPLAGLEPVSASKAASISLFKEAQLALLDAHAEIARLRNLLTNVASENMQAEVETKNEPNPSECTLRTAFYLPGVKRSKAEQEAEIEATRGDKGDQARADVAKAVAAAEPVEAAHPAVSAALSEVEQARAEAAAAVAEGEALRAEADHAVCAAHSEVEQTSAELAEAVAAAEAREVAADRAVCVAHTDVEQAEQARAEAAEAVAAVEAIQAYADRAVCDAHTEIEQARAEAAEA
eukprot:4217369-Pleurochrysis_carterae.AAC.1